MKRGMKVIAASLVQANEYHDKGELIDIQDVSCWMDDVTKAVVQDRRESDLIIKVLLSHALETTSNKNVYGDICGSCGSEMSINIDHLRRYLRDDCEFNFLGEGLV